MQNAEAQVRAAEAAVRELTGVEGPPTTGDVAAALNCSRRAAFNYLSRCPGLFQGAERPAGRWHVRGQLAGGTKHIHAMVLEAAALCRGLAPSDADQMRSLLLDALEGRR